MEKQHSTWPTLRKFLHVPDAVTGRGVRIAVVDGEFPNHPDIGTDERRTVHLVRVWESPEPEVFVAKSAPWRGGAHALWVAAAAAGSGAEAQGIYQGIAPEADLFLVATYSRAEGWDHEISRLRALEWVRDHWREYEIRGVLIANKGRLDSGLLPWQVDPHRILCEELAAAGVLVVAGSGNVPDQTAAMTHAAAPSALSVGGIAIPLNGNLDRAELYQGCRGNTFEGKWVPEILAPAENITLPYRTDEEIEQHFYGKVDELPRRYARTGGTSFAGPIVLGAAACLWQSHPQWTAEEMKAALVATSLKKPQWSSLRTGLVWVEAALVEGAIEVVHKDTMSPYHKYTSLRKKPLEQRLGGLDIENSAELRDAILSFVRDDLPDRIIEPIRKHLRHSDSSVRTAALCALAGCSCQLDEEYIGAALRDASSSVRMAALYALQDRPDLWSLCKTPFRDLFDDESFDIRSEALRLAKKMAYPDFVRCIVAGLEEDARMGRVANFAARRDALEAITGEQLSQQPAFVPGQSPHGEDVRMARMDLARRWEERCSRECN